MISITCSDETKRVPIINMCMDPEHPLEYLLYVFLEVRGKGFIRGGREHLLVIELSTSVPDVIEVIGVAGGQREGKGVEG